MSVSEAHLPHLRVICEHGSRPAEWCGMGRDDAVPVQAAKRLEQAGLIVKVGTRWHPTAKGLHAVGRRELTPPPVPFHPQGNI